MIQSPMVPLIILHLVLTAARPAAPMAKPVPIDTHVLAAVMLPEKPQPQRETVLPVAPAISPKLHLLSFAIGEVDVATTMASKNHWGVQFHEYDPVARPIVLLPNREYQAAALGELVVLNLLADRMNRSPRFERFARPMLRAQIALNSTAIAFTLTNHSNRSDRAHPAPPME